MADDPRIPVTVIDRPDREGDHLFVAEHQCRQVVGAVGGDWQSSRAKHTGPVAISRESEQVEGVEFYDAGGRPAFVVPDRARFDVAALSDDVEVERVRSWYQAGWAVVAMTQFLSEGADLLESMRLTGREKTNDFTEIEGELAMARLSILKAKVALAAL